MTCAIRFPYVTIKGMKRSWLAVAFLSSFLGVLGAQSLVPDSIYRQADEAITSPEKLSSLLAGSSSKPWFPGLESYVLKKARQLVIDDRLPEAKAATLAVIDNNLDNTEAVDLYQTIEKAEARKQKEAAAAAEKQALDTFRQQAAQAKVKQDVAKTYQSVTNKASGKTIYLDQSFNQHYRTWNWDFRLNLANIDLNLTLPGDTAYKYGLGLDASLVRHGESVTVGGEVDASSSFVAVSGPSTVDWTAGGVLFFSGAEGHFALRTGFRVIDLGLGNPDIEEINFPTPILGFALRDIVMGEGNRFRWSVDWYPGHLYTPGMVVAGGTDLSLAFRMADLQDFDIHFYAGIHDTILVRNADIRNISRLSLAIGVGDYE